MIVETGRIYDHACRSFLLTWQLCTVLLDGPHNRNFSLREAFKEFNFSISKVLQPLHQLAIKPLSMPTRKSVKQVAKKLIAFICISSNRDDPITSGYEMEIPQERRVFEPRLRNLTNKQHPKIPSLLPISPSPSSIQKLRASMNMHSSQETVNASKGNMTESGEKTIYMPRYAANGHGKNCTGNFKNASKSHRESVIETVAYGKKKSRRDTTEETALAGPEVDHDPNSGFLAVFHKTVNGDSSSREKDIFDSSWNGSNSTLVELPTSTTSNHQTSLESTKRYSAPLQTDSSRRLNPKVLTEYPRSSSHSSSKPTGQSARHYSRTSPCLSTPPAHSNDLVESTSQANSTPLTGHGPKPASFKSPISTVHHRKQPRYSIFDSTFSTDAQPQPGPGIL